MSIARVSCCTIAENLYLSLMRDVSTALPRALGYAALAAATGVAIGFIFSLWTTQSAEIFLALVDGGLSWCF